MMGPDLQFESVPQASCLSHISPPPVQERKEKTQCKITEDRICKTENICSSICKLHSPADQQSSLEVTVRKEAEDPDEQLRGKFVDVDYW